MKRKMETHETDMAESHFDETRTPNNSATTTTATTANNKSQRILS